MRLGVRGTGRVLRGRSVALFRQEAWVLLLAHNMIASLAARAAATAGLAPGQITFTAVLSLARAAATADTCCPHCGKRPAKTRPSPDWAPPSAPLPADRADRQRTSGRTAAERQKWISEPADYTLTIVPSNLPKTEVPEVKGSAGGPHGDLGAAGRHAWPLPSGRAAGRALARGG
jgi:hypothetical protein